MVKHARKQIKTRQYKSTIIKQSKNMVKQAHSKQISRQANTVEQARNHKRFSLVKLQRKMKISSKVKHTLTNP